MELTCIIIDDENHAIKVLEDHISNTPGVTLIFSENDPIHCIKRLGSIAPPDIIFCDIDMPGLSGLDLSVTFSLKSQLVFTTAFEEYALAGYEKNASDYMLKPITKERFNACIERCVQRKIGHANLVVSEAPQDDHFFIIAMGLKGNHVQIKKQDIVFVESTGNYLRLHLIHAAPVEAYLSFSELSGILDEKLFFRIHRSFLVNIDHIESFQGGKIQLRGTEMVVPLSENYRQAFLDTINRRVLKSSRLA